MAKNKLIDDRDLFYKKAITRVICERERLKQPKKKDLKIQRKRDKIFKFKVFLEH